MPGHVSDYDLLAIVMNVVPRVRRPAMQAAVGRRCDLLQIGPMVLPHVVSNSGM